ncbi:hypothetical protein PVAG01_10668 [Phlyctema vagabunda]|uniref:VTC domain-containing protein n=1 Tax=Phlyctema vagabunda TaxID=108571 RepID=A0ABR4P2W9_9HELO
MSEAKKKLLNLFRSKSTSDRDRPHRRRRDGRRSEGSPRRHRERSHSPISTLDPRRSNTSHVSRHASPPRPMLTEWPPPGISREEELPQGKAMELIATGVPVFKGHRRPVPHAGDEYHTFYATCEGTGHTEDDRAEPFHPVLATSSFNICAPGRAHHPWDTLENPSLAFCYGTRPGTITLNHWVNLSSKASPALELRDPGLRPREIELATILDRLIYLEGGFEEDYEDLMYKNLYKTLLRDPDKYMSPHKAMERQIADLILVLSRPEWIDFSRPENQVVAKFFANATYTDHGRHKNFFHQLLLSIELELRIHSKHHADTPKGQLLGQLPPRIAWDLALARKWRESMSIEKFKTDHESQQIRFHLIQKKPQVKAIRKFARVMKWPNLVAVDNVLRERDPDAKALEDRSSDAMSYFTGMILPGATLPWLVMNTLIDCDDDVGANSLAALTHMHPHTGFQYKSTTYWSSTSIVGKVLGPTCQEIGGWVGPARPAPDLERIQIARTRQRQPKQHLSKGDVESMMIRSDPLGPPSTGYPVAEYELLLPDSDDIVDTVRIEKLALKPSANPRGQTASPQAKDRPVLFDAAIQFAIDGRSWPLRLSYDVSYISAHPCAKGPHPLFFDYLYKAVRVDEILAIKDWGGFYGRTSLNASSPAGSHTTPPATASDEDESEKVLAIECFGVKDNEVLARAWCSHWGLSAVVADVERTCMSCAIREAYAACINVVILVEGQVNDSDA